MSTGPAQRIYSRDETFAFIEAHYNEERRGPTVREIAAHFGCSLATAQQHVEDLRADGRLIPNPGARPGFIIPVRRP